MDSFCLFSFTVFGTLFGLNNSNVWDLPLAKDLLAADLDRYKVHNVPYDTARHRLICSQVGGAPCGGDLAVKRQPRKANSMATVG